MLYANDPKRFGQFRRNIRRGKRFEKAERREWCDQKEGRVRFEVPTRWRGKNGRVDILVDELEGIVAVVEVKGTDWNKILKPRIRETALRHARQIWRYVEPEVERGLRVSPGVVYQRQPRSAKTKGMIEELLNERGVQVVWRGMT